MEALQALHLVGFTHNDVKPSNIMIDFAKDDQVKATLIDFGFAKKFVDSKNNHIEHSEIEMFQGNLVYSSYS
jgi:serine/threonine protein kinase